MTETLESLKKSARSYMRAYEKYALYLEENYQALLLATEVISNFSWLSKHDYISIQETNERCRCFLNGLHISTNKNIERLKREIENSHSIQEINLINQNIFLNIDKLSHMIHEKEDIKNSDEAKEHAEILKSSMRKLKARFHTVFIYLSQTKWPFYAEYQKNPFDPDLDEILKDAFVSNNYFQHLIIGYDYYDDPRPDYLKPLPNKMVPLSIDRFIGTGFEKYILPKIDKNIQLTDRDKFIVIGCKDRIQQLADIYQPAGKGQVHLNEMYMAYLFECALLTVIAKEKIKHFECYDDIKKILVELEEDLNEIDFKRLEIERQWLKLPLVKRVS